MDDNGGSLFSGHHIDAVMGFYRAENVLVLGPWTSGFTPLDQVVDVVAHSITEDTGDRVHLIRSTFPRRPAPTMWRFASNPP